MSAKTLVTLYGGLAEAVGRDSWALQIATPAECLRAIDANSDGRLLDFLMKNCQQDYRVIINGGDIICLEEFAVLRYQELRTVEIMPVLRGSGGQWWMIVAGVVLIALSIVVPALAPVGSWLAAGGAITGGVTMASVAMGIGVSLVLSGIASMLVPTPKQAEQVGPRPSYIFTGPINEYREGNPIPVGFGMLLVGSQTISAGIRSVDQIQLV